MSGFTARQVAVIIDRDAGACVRCGVVVVHLQRGIAWSIHHRRPRGMGGSRSPEVNAAPNGLVLCGSGTTGCHGWVEGHREQARQEGLLVPSWRDPTDVPVRTRRHGWAWARTTCWEPLTVPELWLQAGQWLTDALHDRGVDDTEHDEITRLSTCAAQLFGVMAGDVRRTA